MRRNELCTPCYIILESALRRNGEILKKLREDTGCKILLAQKCFSNYEVYDILSEYIDGTEASGLYEARLGFEKMPGRECHVFSAAFREDELSELLGYADHIVFNSLTQLKRYGSRAKAAGKSVGLRLNPEFSTQEGHEIYDPCAPGSRLGVRRAELDALEPEKREKLLGLLDGLHFHTLCEQDSDALESTLGAVLERFADLFALPLKWINLGGGHHITRDGYDIPRLERCVNTLRGRGLEVYLEPGEAVALNAGVLVSEVLDVRPADSTGIPPAILDTSAACHMPDVLEMPYRPPLEGASDDKPCKVRLGSQTCLAGDVIGVYGFDSPLEVGDRLTFGDMAIYTMVKTNTFNGMPLPDIVLEKPDGECVILRRFCYNDFFSRL